MRTCDQGDGGDPRVRRQGNLDQVAGAWFDDVLITLIVVIIIAITIVIILIVVIITIIVIVITFIAIDQIINAHQVEGA